MTFLDYAKARAARRRRADLAKAQAFLGEAGEILSGLELPLPSAGLDVPCVGGDQPSRFVITSREAEVLALVARGLSNREIAGRLGITSFTVARHIEGILSKVGASNRAEAVTIGIRGGMIAEG